MARVQSPRALRDRLITLSRNASVLVVTVAIVACMIASPMGFGEMLLAIDLVVALALVIVAIVMAVLIVLVLFGFALIAIIREAMEDDS